LDLFEINLKTSIRLYPISITFHKWENTKCFWYKKRK
jgi:hypothetical protein